LSYQFLPHPVFCSDVRKTWTRKKKSGSDKKSGLETISAPAFTYYNYGVDITEADFLDVPDNAAEQKFNYVGHALTLCLLELYTNHPSLMENLIIQVSEKRNLMYNMFEFAENNPEIDDIFNTIFAQRFENFNPLTDTWQGYVETNYKYTSNYIPFAMIANKGSYDTGFDPMVAAPFEISEDKHTTFDDDYPMWIKNSLTRSLDFTTINERIVGYVQNPILVIVNGKLGDDDRFYLKYKVTDAWESGLIAYDPVPVVPMSCDLNPLPWGHHHNGIKHKGFKINYRYENIGKSEYTVEWIHARAYRPLSDTYIPYGPISGGGAARPNHHQKVHKVRKSEVGTWFTWDWEVFGPNQYKKDFCFDIDQMTTNDEWYFFSVAMYEKDGIAPQQLLGYVRNEYGDTVEYRGKMKFEDEYYFFEPSTNNHYPFVTRHGGIGVTYTDTNKGELQLKREAY